jgi:hypothetical protein
MENNIPEGSPCIGYTTCIKKLKTIQLRLYGNIEKYVEEEYYGYYENGRLKAIMEYVYGYEKFSYDDLIHQIECYKKLYPTIDDSFSLAEPQGVVSTDIIEFTHKVGYCKNNDLSKIYRIKENDIND